MSKITTLALAQLFACDQAAQGQLERYYDDEIRNMGHDKPWTTALSITTVTAGTSTYAIPTNALSVLAVIYDERELDRATEQELETVDPNWRNVANDTPRAYIQEEETTVREITIYPTPTRDGAAFVPAVGSPVGEDYPADNIVTIYTDERIDVQPWLEPMIALRILSHEFARQSAHRDPEFATLCARIADVFEEAVA